MTTNEQEKSIPDDPVRLIEQGMKVYARHRVMGRKSPLLALQFSSWEENGSKINDALRLQQLIKEVGFPQEYIQKYYELTIKIKASINQVTFYFQIFITTILLNLVFGDLI